MADHILKVSEVFTPNDTPTVSYVERTGLNLEKNLEAYLALPKMVVSISGPSKSGKTVLIKKVLDDDSIIPVIGSGIKSPEDLWNRTLRWMEVPTSVETATASGINVGLGASGGGEAGIPFVAKGKVEAKTNIEKQTSTTTTELQSEDGLTKVIKEISGSGFIIFVDDFHYIKEELREEIGRQIKVVADNGVKVVTASVPHRSDDVVRSNPELRGRVAAVDLGYWEMNHLISIGDKGFRALNCDLAPSLAKRLAEEAMGSPQLMQTICYCLCQTLNISQTLPEHKRVEVSEAQIQSALKQTSFFTDFSKMLSSLHSGPRTRGQERKEHNFSDGSAGDVYRSVLLAIRADPIGMSFTYDNIMTRVKSVCTGDSPVGSSINSCLEQMSLISEELQPGRPVLAWDGDNLDVTDPYFAFFLRSSDKIENLI